MNNRSHLAAIPITSLIVLLGASLLLAYEVEPVPSGGAVTGTVRFKGEVTALPNLKVIKDQTACGMDVIDESLIVNEGLIQNVVVSIAGITAGKEPDVENPTLDNHGCRFVPHVQTAQVGSRLVIANSDPILHNTHCTYEDGETVFNIALPLQNQRVRKRIKRAGVLAMKCDAGHTWMNAYVVVFEHPYHATTGTEGSFTISDIPPGQYTLSLWHEKLATQTVAINIEAGKTASIEIEMGEEQ